MTDVPEDEQHPRLKTTTDIQKFMSGLIELWDGDGNLGFEVPIEYARATGPTIWSLANHVVELCRTIVDLSEKDRMLVAMPLVRLTIDCSMTAAWLLVSPDAVSAMLHEGYRQRRAAVEQIVALGAEGFDVNTLKEAADELAQFAEFKSPEGASLEQRFRALHRGESIYSSYRLASALSHAGMTLADAYLVEVPKSANAPLGVALSPTRQFEPHEAWLGTAASMLLLAMKAADAIDVAHGHEGELAEAQEILGVSLDIRRADSR